MEQKKIEIFTLYDHAGPSSRYRFFQYIPHLEKSGFRCSVNSLFNSKYINKLFNANRRPVGSVVFGYFRRQGEIRNTEKADLVLIEKELFPYLSSRWEARMARNTPFVVDYDDAVFHRYDLSSNRLVRRLLTEKIPRVMRQASVVTVGNQYLADHASQAGAKRVEIIPTSVDLSSYPSLPPPEGPFTVGWIGTPVTSRYLQSVGPALREGLNQNGKLLAIGDKNVEIPGVYVDHRKWSSDTEARNLSDMNVGIMPLPDNPWERGKCGFKLIQYMAAGRPVIASPVGVNKEIVIDGHNGFLASSPDEWVEAIRILREDPQLGERMGRRGHEMVNEKFSIEVNASKMANIYRQVLRNGA